MHRREAEAGRFEELAARLAATLDRVAPDQVDGRMEGALRQLAEDLDLELALLWQAAPGAAGAHRLTHGARARPGPPLPEPAWLEERLPWCAQRVAEAHVLLLPSLDALPRHAVRDLETLRSLAVGSTLGLALSAGGAPVDGVLTFHSGRNEPVWAPSVVRQLLLISHLLASALARQRADVARLDSETRLATAVHVAGLGFFELRDGFEVAFLDDRLRRLLGIPRTQAQRAPELWQQHIHPSDRERVERLTREALEGTRDSVSVEYRYQHRYRGIVWLNQLLRVLERGADLRAVRAIGVIQDVTARRRALHELARSEKSFRATFEQAPVGVAHLAADGRFLRVNASFCEFVGYSREALQQRTLADITHRADAALDAEQVRQMRDGEIEVVSAERRYVRESGEEVWGQVTVSAVRERAGKPDWFVAIVQDVTARKEAEEELNRMHAQLWHADRAAQIGVLSASLAHELNQPLSAILANAQAALRFLATGEPDLDEIRTILKDIVQDDKRAGMVVSGLRAMLRRRATLREKIPLAEALQELLRLLRTEMLDRRVQVTVHAAADLGVRADRTQFQQVVLNLLMNAMDAVVQVPDERRRVEMEVVRTERGEVRIAVRDHGPGISQDQGQRMFEAFWTTKESGMGIGLAISRSIVESHGGRLWYENHPDGGAVFYFTLPLEEA